MFFVDKETQENRLAICESCDQYTKLLSQCKQCGCIMTAKVKLGFAKCPIGKW